MSNPIDYLFVYGTLRSGTASAAHNEFIAPEFTLVGRANIAGRLYLISDYPGLMPSKHTTDMVTGEVYSFTGGATQLAEIDDYEDCGALSPTPHLYTRFLKPVTMQNGTVLSAWVYFYNYPVSEDRLIRSGDFLDPF